jgi:glycosyltransferase involved in cell wall biosynthesis
MALAKDLGIAGQVIFAGRISRDGVLELLRRCDSFVLASRVETFGVSVVEALALGVPVIATRSGGPESIISDEDGFLVTPDKVDELSDAMKKMVADRERFDSFAIRRRCAGRYSEKVVVERLLGIYKTAVELAYEP